MLIRTTISASTIESIIFKTESGVISSHLGDLTILDGFSSLDDCIIATKKWLNLHIGLQVEYHTNN